VENEEENVAQYYDQVALDGKPIFRWILVGFWAGDIGVWSNELKYQVFFK